ncbi:MAG: tetratricopeptide repeat protein, partial [Caldilineaceae bacterium]
MGLASDLYTYFAQQVLDKQAPVVRDFLLKTSSSMSLTPNFAPRFLGTGNDAMDLEEILDYVRRNNLFVSSVGRYGDQIRYLACFRTARDKFIQNSPGRRAIGRTVGRILCRGPTLGTCAPLFTRLDDIPSRVEFLKKHGQVMLRAGQMQLLVHWIGELPQLVRFDHPSLTALHGAALVSTGATDYGVTVLTQVESTLAPDACDALHLHVLVYRSAGLRMLGRYDEALADAEHALRMADQMVGCMDATELAGAVALAHRLKGLALFMMGEAGAMPWLFKALTGYQSLKNAHDSAIVSMEIGLAYLTTGDFLQAQPWFEAATETWAHLHNVAGLANVLNNLGYLHYLRGDYEASAAALLKAQQAAQRSGYRRLEAYIISGLADLMATIGFDKEAVDVYQRAKALAKRVNERFLILYIELAETTLAWQLADQEAAYQNLNRAGQLVLNRDSDYEWSLYRLTVGRFYVAIGKPEDALEPLRDAVEHLSVGNRSIDLVVAQLYRALALAEADPAAARSLLAAAAADAAAAEYYPHFVALAAREKRPLTALINSMQGGPARDLPAQFQAFGEQTAALRKTLRALLFEAL